MVYHPLFECFKPGRLVPWGSVVLVHHPFFFKYAKKVTTSPVALECSSGKRLSPMHLAPGVDPSSRGSAAP